MTTTSHHQPRKRFGQHFLQSEPVINNILLAINLQREDNAVEIGPGLGALTTYLLPLVTQLNVIEIDSHVIPLLEEKCCHANNLKIHNTDALKFDFTKLAKPNKPLRLVGNLPYNISTPLLFHFIDQIAIIHDMHFMLQKEVVMRMVAKPKSDAYGRLSVMLQYYCHAEALFHVPPDAFKPQPNVDSAVVRLIPYKEKPHLANDLMIFSEIVKQAFSQRRKTLRNNLKSLINTDILNTLDIKSTARAEELSVADFVNIANTVTPS